MLCFQFYISHYISTQVFFISIVNIYINFFLNYCTHIRTFNKNVLPDKQLEYSAEIIYRTAPFLSSGCRELPLIICLLSLVEPRRYSADNSFRIFLSHLMAPPDRGLRGWGDPDLNMMAQGMVC